MVCDSPNVYHLRVCSVTLKEVIGQSGLMGEMGCRIPAINIVVICYVIIVTSSSLLYESIEHQIFDHDYFVGTESFH